MKIKRAILALSFVCFSVSVHGATKLKSFATVSQTASFNEMVVRHAKRLCNGDLHQVFSQDGRDFLDFWTTASEVNLELEKAYTCFRLFFNHMKWCEVIDYTVVEHVLKATPQLFERYFEQPKTGPGEFNLMRDHVEDLMLGRFTDNLDCFHNEPDIFLSKLSTDVMSLVKSRLSSVQQEDETREYQEKMRNILIRFSDMIISKLIWYENDYQRIWPSFIAIADSLHAIGTRGIINDQDNLDELWDSLVKRFVWFLDFRGSTLPVEFYEQVEEDLKSNVVFFLEVDEQDEGVKTKKEIVAEAIIKGKTKAIALEQGGVFSDPM